MSTPAWAAEPAPAASLEEAEEARNAVRDTDPAFLLHRGGKIEVTLSVPLETREDLSLAYTPGVARVCTAIAEQPLLADDYTWRANTVAVVTDGTAVLGLGDIGPAAALPVMEGKALLFKHFAGVDAVPICLDCKDVDGLVETVVRLAPGFGGINLEDISAPRCFEIERRLQELLDIPVFHDDQHGTAIVVLAALENAAKLTGRTLGDLRAVVSGAGAAGIAVTRILLAAGIGDIAVADSKGVVHKARTDLTDVKTALAADTNVAGHSTTIEDALAGADVFLGLSAGKVSEEAIASMADEFLRLRHGQPRPRDRPGDRRQVRAGRRHRSQRLPQPDQQRARFPGRLPGCVRGSSAAGDRGDEASRRSGACRRRGRRPVRGLRDPECLRRAGRALGRVGGCRSRPAGGRRPALSWRYARPQTGQRAGRSVIGSSAPHPALLHRATS